MVGFRHTIRRRLFFFVTAFAAILLGLSVIATASLITVDQKSETISDKWLAGTRLLGELSDRISEFRLAEVYRALASGVAARSEAELLADHHRRTIEALLDQYVTLVGNSSAAEQSAFRNALKAYLTGHDAWVKADSGGMLDDPALYRSALHDLYKATDLAVDRLIASNSLAVEKETSAIDKIVHHTIVAVIAVSVVTLLVGAWFVMRVRIAITGPLGQITAALSQLAAGNRKVLVPGPPWDDEIGAMVKAFEVFRANAHALEQAHEATLAAQAHALMLARHDPLTGLPNRRLFSARLETAINHVRDGSAVYLVLVVDLDRFKPVNDLQGHLAGDLVLCEVAQRLREVVGNSDTVARLGGDEFALLAQTDPHDHTGGAMLLAARLLDAVRRPIDVDESRIEVGASIGIASCPADGLDPESLLRAADIAMYRAKREGGSHFRFFELRMDEELRAQAALEEDLRSAVAKGEIHPHYQPQVDLRDNSLYGFEILARWQHPTRGSVPPDVFIPLAEQLGLILELTSSILRQACRDASRWASPVQLSLNISPVQLKDTGLPSLLLAILSEEDFAARRLEIEITETALVADFTTARQILAAFHRAGIRMSLDDFGTGYSSLSHLRELRFDKVKIDKSFVLSMQRNSDSEKIVDVILSLAKSLGMAAVAEGIEDPDVARSVTAKGCEYGQGFHFGAAMPADKVAGLLKPAQTAQL